MGRGEKWLEMWTLKFVVKYGGWQEPEAANDLHPVWLQGAEPLWGGAKCLLLPCFCSRCEHAVNPLRVLHGCRGMLTGTLTAV